MTKRKIFYLLPLFILFTCAIPSFLYNSKYTFRNDTYSLAILPCEISSKLPIDSFFIDMFAKSLKMANLIDPARIREMARNDNRLAIVISKLMKFNNSQDTSIYNLQSILSNDDAEYLKSKLANPTFILIPDILLSPSSGYLQVTSFSKLYDLNQGKLIYFKINSNSGSLSDDKTESFLLFMQIGMIHNDFNYLFIDKFIKSK